VETPHLLLTKLSLLPLIWIASFPLFNTPKLPILKKATIPICFHSETIFHQKITEPSTPVIAREEANINPTLTNKVDNPTEVAPALVTMSKLPLDILGRR